MSNDEPHARCEVGSLVSRRGHGTAHEKQEATSAESQQKSEKEAFDDISSQIHNFLKEWKTAWESSAGDSGDIAHYISFYSSDFKSGRLNKSGWASDKTRKNRRKKWIRVEFSDIKIMKPDNNQVKVKFSQDYKSSNFSVVSEKVLLLKQESGKWTILSEKSD